MPVKYFPPIRGWQDYTPVIPKLYWDVESVEQRIKQLCREYDRIVHYLDLIQQVASSNDKELQAQIDELADALATLQRQVDYLTEEIGLIAGDMPVWDPTRGLYSDSKEAMRNMYRELAVFGAREVQIEDLTVEELAEYRVDEISAVGNLTIFNDDKPRVTDPKTGKEYENE